MKQSRWMAIVVGVIAIAGMIWAAIMSINDSAGALWIYALSVFWWTMAIFWWFTYRIEKLEKEKNDENDIL